jgi:prevent-host-death family protein
MDELGGAMNNRVDAHIARTQFGQLMDRAVRNKERFVVDRRGEPAVVILSVQDYLDTVQSAPEWLRKAWAEAKKRGVDRLTMAQIDAEIDVYRREKQTADK